MYLKYIYFMPSILQIHLYIYVLNKNILQLYYKYTKLVWLKSAKLEQLILYLKALKLCRSSAEVQLKIYWSIFDCAKVELLQVCFRYTLNILHVKTDIIEISQSTSSDIKTHFKLNIKKCALCTSSTPNKIVFNRIFISVRLEQFVSK